LRRYLPDDLEDVAPALTLRSVRNDFRDAEGSETIVPMPDVGLCIIRRCSLAVGYFVFRLVLRVAPDGDKTDREAEILVLRRQFAVSKRTNPRPRLRRRDPNADRGPLEDVPRVRWSGFSVPLRRSSAGTGRWSPASARSSIRGPDDHRSIPTWSP
jgi:hypothetical protein